MVKTKHLHLAIIFLMLCISTANAQTKLSKIEMEDRAYAMLNSGDFANAYVMFDKLNSEYPMEYDYKFKLGMCCLSYPEKHARAIEIFRELKEKYKNADSDYYLGKAYHVNYKFNEALAVLEPLVASLSASKRPADQAIVDDATLGIANCKNGLYLIENKVIADITNIGAPINTAELEGVPVITADESMMIFTYSGKKSLGGKLDESLKPDEDYGKYLLDIYRSNKNAEGTWGPPEPIKALNTQGNDAAIGISPDGQNLFVFFSNSKNPGDIYFSKLTNNDFSKPEPLNSNINSIDYWEGSCSVSADGRFLYFSSERPGGMGGRDIYVSQKVNGDWGPAVNLGPKINTKYDDDAPFIHPDGITLFFSSKGHQSIGGYDIMFSIKKDNDWAEPKSMGIPLNTTDDDSFYVINSKGEKGYFSSNRPGSGGFGDLDIYMVTPGILGEKPVVALLKGVVYGNDKPIEAKIEVVKTVQNENVGPYYSNMSTGKYLLALSPGSVYHIKVSAEGFDNAEEDLDLGSLNAYMEQNKDFHLNGQGMAKTKSAGEAGTDSTKKDLTTTSPSGNNGVTSGNPETMEPPVKTVKEKTAKTKEKVNDPKENESLAVDTPCTDMPPDLAPFKGKSLKNESDYKQLINVAGNYCAQNALFKVQVGAYRDPGNFRYDNIKNLGKIESEIYPDGLTRFTQKQFKNLRDAEKHRQKLIGKGIKDAWIVVFSDGKRYTLEDFINVDFLGKTVN